LQTLKYHHEASDISALWSYGFGQVHGVNVAKVFVARNSSQFISTVMFANSWQLIISLLHVLLNSLATTFCAAEEYSHFGKERKFLRVSAPRGLQRSTYFLSLPYRYGIPIAVTLSLLHWTTSQAVFFFRTAAFWPDGTRDYAADSSRVGFSSIGIIFAVITASVLILSFFGYWMVS